MDLRIVKTHKAIRSAFIELLQHTEYEKIAVQDIIDTALVNRSTFYKYYSGKSDLAGKMIGEFKTEYETIVKERFECSNLKAFYASAVPLLRQQRQLILALWKIKTKRHHLYDDMHQILKKAYIKNATGVLEGGNLDYQGEMFATLLLATAHYNLTHEKPLEIGTSVQEWRQMIELVG